MTCQDFIAAAPSASKPTTRTSQPTSPVPFTDQRHSSAAYPLPAKSNCFQPALSTPVKHRMLIHARHEPGRQFDTDLGQLAAGPECIVAGRVL